MAKRSDEDVKGRFRKFSREWIAERGDSLDISWLQDESNEAIEDLPEPNILAKEVIEKLEIAIEKLNDVLLELGEEVEE